MLKSQRGNALFLILIAVILFAALSYAITQSNRSSGNTSSEVNLTASTSVVEYASAISSGIMRMTLRGVSPSQISFVSPDKPAFSDPDEVPYNIFHPNGGGVAYQNVDPNTVELDTDGSPLGGWAYLDAGTGESIKNVGTSAADIIVELFYVRKGICEQINEKLTGSKTIPSFGIGVDDIGDGQEMTGAGIDGRAAMCVATTDNPVVYVYYQVVLEQ